MSNASPVLVTGAAGFVGRAVAERLLAEGRHVVGIDNFSPYYDVALKHARVATLQPHPAFRFVEMDIADRAKVDALFANHRFERVVHLAAQAGVRYSLTNPHAYADANLTGFLNLIEASRQVGTQHFLFASSSSVYGVTPQQPFSEEQAVDHPISLYAATKKANELMAHAYAHLYRLPVTGLRFFTVYGPWGRPDMAVYTFVRAAFDGATVSLYNHGDQRRDFTYIDDIVSGVVALVDKPAEADATFDPARPNPATSNAPYRIYNIGNNRPAALMDLVRCIEKHTGRKLNTVLQAAQPGDVFETYANVDALAERTGFAPRVTLDEGIRRFVDWYRAYHAV